MHLATTTTCFKANKSIAAGKHTPRKINRHDLPKTAYTASLQDKSRPILEALAGPAHGESPEDMTMRHDEHVAGWLGLLGVRCSLFHHRRVELVTDVGYEAIKPGGYVLWASFKFCNRGQSVLSVPSACHGITHKCCKSSTKTYSPPGHPSLQISHLPSMPCFLRISLISGLVMPSYSP